MPTLPDSSIHESALSPAAVSRRERRSADIRERLFRSALRLFAEKGFAETTVEDITEAADVGKGTFFNYFPSKDHILLAFSDMQLGKLSELVAHFRNSNQSLREFIQELTQRMTEEPLRNPGMIRALLLGYLSSSAVREVMTGKQKHALALHTQIIEIGQSRGELRKDIPAIELRSSLDVVRHRGRDIARSHARRAAYRVEWNRSHRYDSASKRKKLEGRSELR